MTLYDSVTVFAETKRVFKSRQHCNYYFFLSIFRWQESIAGVSLDDICDIRERNSAARMLDINFVEEIAWLKYDIFLLQVIIIFDV